ncbi:processed acidic surface protein [Bacillus sp. OAE603]|uniref:processed acidic surface protein n=1 Tax=Gottfriedia sp. OAE603 TaxID=2663872 RepID=UPI0017897665
MKKIVASIVLSAALVTPGVTALAAPDQTELDAYLTSINMTQDELEEYLNSYYGESIEDYDSVEELEETLGDPLTKESLAALLDEYGYTEEEVKELAVFYDDMDEDATLLDTYYFTSDVEYLILMEEEDTGSPTMEDFADIFEMMGITEDEINHLTDYIDNVMSDDPAVEAKLEVLAERMTDLSDQYEDIFSMETTPEELPAALTAELANIVKELQSTLKIDVKVSIEQNGVKSPLTFAQMLTMDDSLETAENVKLYVDIFDNAGNLLLDAVLSDELFSEIDIPGLVDDVKTVVSKPQTISRTENGGKLPKTASHTTEWALAGAFMMLSALALRKKANANR